MTHPSRSPSRYRQPDEVEAFLADVRSTYVTEADPGVATRHLAAMAREHARLRSAAAWPWWRRVLRRGAALGAVKVALTAGAAVAATGGGLAASGNLPDPIQHAVAEAVEPLGITLPDPAAEVVARTPAGGAEPPGQSGVRPDDGTPIGRPDNAGPPANAGRPDGAGPAADRRDGGGPPARDGRPPDVDPPDEAGAPQDAGPAEDAGAGTPADAAPLPDSADAVGRPGDAGLAGRGDAAPAEAGGAGADGRSGNAGVPADGGPPAGAGPGGRS